MAHAEGATQARGWQVPGPVQKGPVRLGVGRCLGSCRRGRPAQGSAGALAHAGGAGRARGQQVPGPMQEGLDRPGVGRCLVPCRRGCPRARGRQVPGPCRRGHPEPAQQLPGPVQKGLPRTGARQVPGPGRGWQLPGPVQKGPHQASHGGAVGCAEEPGPQVPVVGSGLPGKPGRLGDSAGGSLPALKPGRACPPVGGSSFGGNSRRCLLPGAARGLTLLLLCVWRLSAFGLPGCVSSTRRVLESLQPCDLLDGRRWPAATLHGGKQDELLCRNRWQCAKWRNRLFLLFCFRD